MSEDRQEPADLDRLLEDVRDEASFIAFLEALSQDFTQERALEATDRSSPGSAGKLGWENGSVDSVLDAAASWGHATSSRWRLAGEGNIWRRCAEILLAGKFYE